MTFEQSIEFLYSLRPHGAKPGLQTTRYLAAMAGNPQERLRFIHVAGTNGKGSTCAMLEAIYRESGLRVGLYTSPHLIRFGERIQVNRQFLPEKALSELLEEIRPWLKQFEGSQHPTFFEIVTVLALMHFERQKCDLVIWETGLGGRLDSTNIVTPLASLITNIDFDHQQWLGESLSQIAFEKAGIIKPGIPVLTTAKQPEALNVIRSRAVELKAPYIEIQLDQPTHPRLSELHIRLLGPHQKANASLVLAAVEELQKVLPVGLSAIQQGLEHVSWHGRMQVIKLGEDQRVVLDGAHNPAGINALARTLEVEFPGEKPLVILAVMRDKDCAAICHCVARFASAVVVCPVESDRTALPSDLLKILAAESPHLDIRSTDSLSTALSQTRDATFRVITGSLHFMGEALTLLQPQTSCAPVERGLNEWTADFRK